MNRILQSASVGALIALVADVLRWSPVGRVISLSSIEGPGAAVLDGQLLRISEAREGNLIVCVNHGQLRQPNRGPLYLLCPRHSGWTAGSLMATSIAVNIHDIGPQGPGPAIAIAVARLARVP